MALWELIRLSDGLVNQSFCRWDFSRVQLKSKWTVGRGLLASGSKTFWKSRLILSRSLLLLFYGWFGNWFISKELVSRGASGWCYVALQELLRHSDGLANQSFYWWDISRTQLKSNWSVGKRLIASDSKVVWKSRLILSKSLLTFLMVDLEIHSFRKN